MRRTLPDVLRKRAVIDYALVRRAMLADVARGVVSRREVCDAHPDLLRAARHHGVPTKLRCPICRNERPLVTVTYVYGDELGESSGRTRSPAELEALDAVHGELRVWVVEVCRSCSWNHTSSSFCIGTGESADRRPMRRRAAGP